jgi:hypothetical protein
MEHFDPSLLALSMEISSTERVQMLKELSFALGSFILPKYMNTSFEAKAPEEGSLPEIISMYMSEVMTQLYRGQPLEKFGVTTDHFGLLAGLSLE